MRYTARYNKIIIDYFSRWPVGYYICIESKDFGFSIAYKTTNILGYDSMAIA